MILETVLLGLVVGLATRGTVAKMQDARLNHERYFILVLLLYLAWPSLGNWLGVGQREFISIWLLLASCVAGLALMNTRYVGMILAVAGLVANILVVTLNVAMPVHLQHAGTDAERVQERIADSMLHEPVTDQTLLPQLGDTLFVPGPSWHRALVSYGDLLLALGVGAVVVQMMHSQGDPARD
ncbi:MAG: DUF5317 domain-containing protein [Coriobacteriia bacterium]|nr:DUF5317 domain-containing protein [Coriobacteriia bacterium]